jgi:hypothetical protein
MKFSVVLRALVALFTAGVFRTWAQEGLDSELSWHHDYAGALAEAKRTGQPLFLEFRCVP